MRIKAAIIAIFSGQSSHPGADVLQKFLGENEQGLGPSHSSSSRLSSGAEMVVEDLQQMEQVDLS
jgi:hypothetical protein